MAQWEIQRDSQRLKHCVLCCACVVFFFHPRAPTEFPVPSNLITITSIILAFFFLKTVDHFRFIFATQKKKEEFLFQNKRATPPRRAWNNFFLLLLSSHRRHSLSYFFWKRKKTLWEKSESAWMSSSSTHIHKSIHTKAPGAPWCSNQHLLTRGQVGGTRWGCNLFFFSFSLSFFAPSYRHFGNMMDHHHHHFCWRGGEKMCVLFQTRELRKRMS